MHKRIDNNIIVMTISIGNPINGIEKSITQELRRLVFNEGESPVIMLLDKNPESTVRIEDENSTISYKFKKL